MKANALNKINLFRYEINKQDTRKWIQYHLSEPLNQPDFQALSLLRPESWQPPQLRFNPLRNEWTSYSTSRNSRPFLPNSCPLCLPEISGRQVTEVPEGLVCFDIAVFENMFPALSGDIGTTEVIVYTAHHDTNLLQLPLTHVQAIVQVWQERSAILGQNYNYIYIFENKGEVIGVTLHHPHGQIYAFHDAPPTLSKELESARNYFEIHKKCLVCELRDQEQKEQIRVIAENNSMIAFVPKSARYPYEVHVTSKQHRPLIEHLDADECLDLAKILKCVIYRLNKLFEFEMPYVMAQHQGPSDQPDNPSYHWHIEFYPPYRSANKLKYLAGVEVGMGFFVNDTLPEESAAQLRMAPLPREWL